MSQNLYTTFEKLSPEKQKLILHAAINEFSENGYAQASCNKIVRGCSISKGSLFQYFGSKEGLFVYICKRFIRKVKDAVKQTSPEERGFFDLIRGVLLSGVAFIDRYPEFFQIYVKIVFDQDAPGRTVFLSKVRLFSADYFGRSCQEAMIAGVLRADLDVEMLLFSIDAALDKFFLSYAGVGMSGLSLCDLSKREIKVKINELVAVLENGLAR